MCEWYMRVYEEYVRVCEECLSSVGYCVYLCENMCVYVGVYICVFVSFCVCAHIGGGRGSAGAV